MGAAMTTTHRHHNTPRLRALLAPTLAALGACAPAGDPDATTETAASPIAREIAGTVDMAFRRYGEPETARVSFATPTIPGCSATMIGPNFMMSAAHCGDATQVTFGTTRNDDPRGLVSETFPCRMLLGAFPRVDIELYWCGPNVPGGVAPGDKYGYLDLDARPVSVGQSLYSVWWNSVDSLGVGWSNLYSAGRVTSKTVTIWGAGGWHNQVGPMQRSVGLSTDLWSNPGCSGSSLINPSNSRVMGGPTSTSSLDGRGRQNLPMYEILRNGRVDGSWTTRDTEYPQDWRTGVEDPAVRALGLNPADYTGPLDENRDDLFDIQVDAERVQGENARAYYHLNFDSERRNAQWVRSAGATLTPSTGQARLVGTASAVASIRHPGLHLKPNTTYRLSVMTSVASASSATSLAVLFQTASGVLQDARFLPTTVGAAWPTLTTTLRTGAQSPDLILRTTAAANFALANLVLVEDNSTNDFDTADQRTYWKDQNTGLPAILMPEGSRAGTGDWAGLARRNPARPLSDDWSLRNRQLALQAGQSYDLCFDVRARTLPPAGTIAWGVMRVTSGSSEVMRHVYTPTTAWQTVCAPRFTTPVGDSSVMFGVAANSPNGTSGPSYLVDNVRILRAGTQPTPAANYSDANWWHLYVGNYGTIRMGDINGDGRSDVCGRAQSGVYCDLGLAGGGFGPQSQWQSEMTDANGFAPEQYSGTMQLADVSGDGRADLCVRGVAGMYCALSTGSSFAALSLWSGAYADANGWGWSPGYYRSFRLADVNGDRRADLCARGAAGVYCSPSTGYAFAGASVWQPALNDADGGADDVQVRSLQFGDVSGDGRADLCVHRVGLVRCALASTSGAAFGALTAWTTTTQFADDPFRTDPSYSATFRLADTDRDGRADLCARTAGGLQCARSLGGSFAPPTLLSPAQMSDAQGWRALPYAMTLQLGDPDGDGRVDACGRESTGYVCRPAR